MVYGSCHVRLAQSLLGLSDLRIAVRASVRFLSPQDSGPSKRPSLSSKPNEVVAFIGYALGKVPDCGMERTDASAHG